MYMIIGAITIAVVLAILFLLPATINDIKSASKNDQKRHSH